jgi:hypothetical protein
LTRQPSSCRFPQLRTALTGFSLALVGYSHRPEIVGGFPAARLAAVFCSWRRVSLPGTLGGLAVALLLSIQGVSNAEPELGAGGLRGVRLVAVAPAEQTAVVSTEPGRLDLVAAGEELGETGFQVVGILSDRLLLEQEESRAGGLTAWLFVAADGRDSLARYFAKRRPVPPAIRAPSQPEGLENARSMIVVGSREVEPRTVGEEPQ